MTSPEARGEAIVMLTRDKYSKASIHDWEKVLGFLHRQGWSYGLIRYLDPVTGDEVCQIDAHQGDTWEKGTGRNWTEAARDLVSKIYDTDTLNVH